MTEEQKEKRREYKKKWYQENKEKMSEINKKWYQENKEKMREAVKKWKEDNKERIKEVSEKWYQENKEKIKENKKKWYQENKGMVRDAARKREKLKRDSNPLFKLTCNLRNRISKSITRKGYKKTSKTTDILGIDFESFKLHLENQFEPWMNWDNYGKYKRDTFNHGWDIDHIIPCSSGTTEEEVIKLNHYTNLRPLCSKINRDVKKAHHL
jgi:hypothetical protein